MSKSDIHSDMPHTNLTRTAPLAPSEQKVVQLFEETKHDEINSGTAKNFVEVVKIVYDHIEAPLRDLVQITWFIDIDDVTLNTLHREEGNEESSSLPGGGMMSSTEIANRFACREECEYNPIVLQFMKDVSPFGPACQVKNTGSSDSFVRLCDK